VGSALPFKCFKHPISRSSSGRGVKHRGEIRGAAAACSSRSRSRAAVFSRRGSFEFDELVEIADLFARAEEAIRQWPVPRKRRSFGFIVGDDRPDSIGELAWASRRLRDVRNVPPAPLTVSDDGLPKGVEVSLVEAWSWCAFGQAVPPSVWHQEAELAGADEAYAFARQHLAHCKWEYRRAKRG
jgi:hypothetical protein